eukprot:361420-Chlamydomonas_euryale.AAC.1
MVMFARVERVERNGGQVRNRKDLGKGEKAGMRHGPRGWRMRHGPHGWRMRHGPRGWRMKEKGGGGGGGRTGEGGRKEGDGRGLGCCGLGRKGGKEEWRTGDGRGLGCCGGACRGKGARRGKGGGKRLGLLWGACREEGGGKRVVGGLQRRAGKMDRGKEQAGRQLKDMSGDVGKGSERSMRRGWRNWRAWSRGEWICSIAHVKYAACAEAEAVWHRGSQQPRAMP